MALRLIQVVTGLPPAIDGVGDYALTIARVLRDHHAIESLFVVADPHWRGPGVTEGFPVASIARRTRQDFCSTMNRILETSASPRDAPVLLHCSLYGLANRALAGWIVSALKAWQRENPAMVLMTMFHELDAKGPVWSSAFWLNPIHRRILSELANRSQVQFVSNARYARSLARIARINESQIVRMPVVSTVGEPTNSSLLNVKCRQRQLVIFGRQSSRDTIFAELTSSLQRVCTLLGIERIVEIGPGRKPRTLPFVAVEPLGILEARGVSGVLRNSLFGFVALEPDRLGKSSVFASYCAHGVCPIVDGDGNGEPDGLFEGVHYISAARASPATGDLLSAISASAVRWYQEHTAQKHATSYADWAFPERIGDRKHANFCC